MPMISDPTLRVKANKDKTKDPGYKSLKVAHPATVKNATAIQNLVHNWSSKNTVGQVVNDAALKKANEATLRM